MDWQSGLVIAALLLAAVAYFKSRRPWLARIERKSLITTNEAEFFGRLQKGVPACHVFPQLSFAAFMTDDGKLFRNARWKVRARFDRKIADFVICDRVSLKILAIVELDDRMHDAHADRQRDQLTQAAGYTTFRFTARNKPSVSELAERFSSLR